MRVQSAELAVPRDGGGVQTLAPIVRLLAELELRAVRYCHWKGNAKLERVLSGEKDLDLLVDCRAAQVMPPILARAGFHRVADAPGSAYPGVEHYLGLDERSGALAHLHLHWQMIPTKGNPLWIRLPWEELALATRVKHESHDVYVPAPEVELLVFLVRQALRVRLKHLVAERFGRRFIDDSVHAELQWLSERVNEGAVERRAIALSGERAAREALALIRGPMSAATLRAFLGAMEPAITAYRGRGRLAAVGASAARARRKGRTLTAGGRIIAFLGSDGAGKSTVVRAISEWLGAELDVRPMYFGSGDGKASLPRRALRTLDRARRIITRRSKSSGSRLELPTMEYVRGSSYVDGVKPGLRALWKIVSKLALASEKRDRLETAWRWRTQGMVVICDRFPQTQQLGFNDGPQLTPWLNHRSPLLRAAARREIAPYQAAGCLIPDVVIKLVVSPEVAASRKDDMSLELLRARAESVRALRFPEGTRVVAIDADRPLAVVLAAVRRAIWDAL